MDEQQVIWEGVAAEILEGTGCDDPPVDAWELASLCGVVVRRSSTAAAFCVGDVIHVPSAARPQRQHGLLAHELGHWALQRAGEENTEDGARYLAGALMLPRRAFERDLILTGWSWHELRRRHPNASGEMLARRVVALRDATALIMDQGRVTCRLVSPWLSSALKSPTRLELELGGRATASGHDEREDDLIYAIPIFDGAYRRVIVIAELEQLVLRLEEFP